MIWLISSILLNVGIFLVFSLIEKQKIGAFPVVLINYLVCALVSFLAVFSDENRFRHIQTWQANYWYPIFLGCLFIFTFFVMARTTAKFGGGFASLAAKSSILMPIGISIVLFGEEVSISKLVGFFLAVLGLILILSTGKGEVKKGSLKYFLLVFIGSGIIDTSLNVLQNNTLKNIGSEIISFFIFTAAFLAGLIYYFFFFIKKISFTRKTILYGIALGSINVFSIICLLKGLSYFERNTSIFFIFNNIGIVLITYIVSVVFFGIRPNRWVWLGIFLVLIAVGILQYKN